MSKRARHTKGRPPSGATEVLKLYDDGRWRDDDGKRGRAFSGRSDDGFPMAWGPGCDCLFDKECPMQRAMDKTSDRWRCANGRAFTREASK